MPKKKNSRSRKRRTSCYVWVLRRPNSHPKLFGTKHDYYGGNMPRPMSFSRKMAKWFDTKEDAEMFWIKKIRQYPQAKFLRELVVRRVKLFVEYDNKRKCWTPDYWHPGNRG